VRHRGRGRAVLYRLVRGGARRAECPWSMPL
jgi:hypothetical protein